MLLVIVLKVIVTACMCLFLLIIGRTVKETGWKKEAESLIIIFLVLLILIFAEGPKKTGLMKIEKLPSIVFQLQAQVPTVKNGNLVHLENTADGTLYFVLLKTPLDLEAGSYVKKKRKGNWQLVLANEKDLQPILDLKKPKPNDPNE